eukprot:1018463-Amphidinium_carterae.3
MSNKREKTPIYAKRPVSDGNTSESGMNPHPEKYPQTIRKQTRLLATDEIRPSLATTEGLILECPKF